QTFTARSRLSLKAITLASQMNNVGRESFYFFNRRKLIELYGGNRFGYLISSYCGLSFCIPPALSLLFLQLLLSLNHFRRLRHHFFGQRLHLLSAGRIDIELLVFGLCQKRRILYCFRKGFAQNFDVFRAHTGWP